VGIGTSADISNFQIYGATNPNITLGNSTYTSDFQIAMASAGGNYSGSAIAGDSVIRTISGNLMLQAMGGGSAAIYLSRTNNFVGIHHTSPAANLDVSGSLRITSRTYAAITSGTGVDIIYSGAGQLSCGTRGVGGALTAAAMNYAASGHTFFTGAAAGTNTMTMTSTGTVGIGIASPPPHRLTVFQDGNSLSHEGNAHSMSILSNQGTSGVNQMFMMLDADHTNQCCSIQSIVNALRVWNLCLNPRGGNVGIGITNPGHTLHVVGAIFATGDITAFSDQRYKQNIIRLDRSLDAIRSLSGYSYTREDYRPGERQIGLLAQEVKAVLPEAVSYDSIHDTYSVNYNCLMAPVVESIKELYDQIQAQQAAIRDQQAAIRDQQAAMESQQSVIQKLLDRLGPE